MKLVVLDGHCANPGDLDWTPFQAFGEFTVYDRTPRELVLERAADAEAVLTNKVLLDPPLLEQLPALKYIGVMATGYNVVDCDFARTRDIDVTNVPAYSTPSVAQLVFALLSELSFGVCRHNQAVHDGQWTRCPDFTFHLGRLVELQGKTMGLIGYGQIGQAVARIARAYEMNVIVHTRTQRDPEVEYVDLDELFRRADVLSLHCPLTEQTRGLVNAERLACMKSTAFLINTGRGPLLDESAVAEALNSERIAGVGLDVLSTEPPAPDNPLLTARNCIITPHIAWATGASRQRLLDTLVENLRAWQAGRPQNVVN
jgi:glycerate dehydrogenase